MSAAQFPDAVDSSADLQIWNNAAFDNGEISEDLTASKQSWGSLKSIFGNAKASFDSVTGKENQGLALESQISSVSSSLKSSSTPFKPINACESVGKSRNKEVVKKGFEETVVLKEVGDGKKIDEEIEEIESQIARLNSRLEALRLEKAVRSVKVVEKRVRVVPAKFMEQKQSVKNAEEKKMIDEISNLSARTKVNRRGISLGPAEIISGGRRGMSLGPSEIFGAAKSRQLGKHEMITPVQSRRKSCLFKLQDIDEERVKSCSLSPKSRKAAAKAQVMPRQAVTTIASRKTVKKEDMFVNSVQPKKLFKDGEKSVPPSNKKPLRAGRVVASRYSQNASQASAMRKRSLPENEAENSKRVEKKRSLSVGKTRANETESKNVGTESRVKKRWEIPSEVVVHGSVEGDKSPQSVVVAPDLLPRLRIARCNDSPRDSGPAKKVVELIGKKSFFASDEAVDQSLCQALTYVEEEDEESC
ncbi:hypothetical protein C2S53_008678 [Perilla frutescens var. hirtella]|uniref:Uncharacterized protein n=1 Tax=Perilla frutescens var. hirtella TaxID=608512 RepID=A0AAD4P3W8_PERFH|nr:hypothetical protein C2S53_008678 [Perilla frutescens var. hirtella]